MFRKGGLLQNCYNTRPLEYKWRPIQFCLIVDDFGIEYMGIEHFNHILLVLQRYHQVQTNIAGNKIVGLNVQWDFPSKQVCIDMRLYVKDLLLSLNWPMHKKPQLSPFTTTLLHMARKSSLHQTKIHCPPVARMPQRRSKNYWVPTLLCKSC